MTKVIIALLLIIGIGVIVFAGRKAATFPSPTPSQTATNMTTPTQSVSTQPEPSAQVSQSKRKEYSSAPAMTIDQNKEYFVTLTTTDGTIKIKLFPKEVPKTVNNFVFLVKEGFYNGTKFHRIIKGFMIQGGDPKGDGTGGPGYSFEDEKVTRDYKRGIIAMANSGPNTNGSQFFIMHKDYDLDKIYTIFGEVVEGMDTVDKIADTPVTLSASGVQSKPVDEVKIIDSKVEEL